MIKNQGGFIVRKYIIGFIIGVALTLGFSVGADSFIGKTVQTTLPLIIEGERVEKDVIVVEGSSYVPLKFAGEIFSYDISYDSKNKEVHMQKKVNGDNTNIISINGEKENNMGSLDVAIKNSVILSKKLNRENNESRFDYFIVDENMYVGASFFSNFATWDSKLQIAIITLPGDDPINFLANKEYSKDTDSFIHQGRIFIKLSKLGLKYEIIGDVLWIEAQ